MQFETDQKLIVFFSSCELVEFHYHLFFQTLLGLAATGQSPSGGPRLAFLRLHGNMDQEVSKPGPSYFITPSPLALAPAGLGPGSPQMSEAGARGLGTGLLWAMWARGTCATRLLRPGLVHLRARRPLACIYLHQLLRQQSTTK